MPYHVTGLDCPNCDRFMVDVELDTDEDGHTVEVFTCAYCGETWTD